MNLPALKFLMVYLKLYFYFAESSKSVENKNSSVVTYLEELKKG